MKINKNKGFALGSILLGLVLIAAVAALLSSGSNSTSTMANREKNRLAASQVISLGTNLQSAIQSHLDDNWALSEIRLEETAAACTANTALCLYATGVREPVFPTQALATGETGSINIDTTRIYTFDDSASNFGTASADGALVITGLSESVCKYINAINLSLAYDDTNNPPSATNQSFFTLQLNEPHKKFCAAVGAAPNQTYVYSVILETN